MFRVPRSQLKLQNQIQNPFQGPFQVPGKGLQWTFQRFLNREQLENGFNNPQFLWCQWIVHELEQLLLFYQIARILPWKPQHWSKSVIVEKCISWNRFEMAQFYIMQMYSKVIGNGEGNLVHDSSLSRRSRNTQFPAESSKMATFATYHVTPIYHREDLTVPTESRDAKPYPHGGIFQI